MNTYAYDHNLPCKNPSCKSYGRPHPNCECYASGGSVCASGVAHNPLCQYYASGGPVGPKSKHADTKRALGHAAVHHGLMGMFKEVGKARLQDPQAHVGVLADAKDHWGRLQDPAASEEPVKKTMGVRLATHIAQGEHDKAASLLHGHPLVGGMGQGHLKDAIEHLGSNLMFSDPNPNSMRASMDYMGSAEKGHSALSTKARSFLGSAKSDDVEPEEALRDTLRGHIDELIKDPSKLLEVGGELGHYMPEHATELAAMLTTATEYLSSLKPKPLQLAALDSPIPPDKVSVSEYNRQLDIAEQPLLVMQHVTDGTLIPQDIKTLSTIYPGLYESMVEKAGDALVTAQSESREIPYRQKLALSMLLGQPLDATQSQGSLQAIMSSQGQQQMQIQAKKNDDKVSEVEMKAINRADSMAETSIEQRQIDKRES